jgi:hypothetical protein
LPISVNFMLDKTELTDSFMTNVSLNSSLNRCCFFTFSENFRIVCIRQLRLFADGAFFKCRPNKVQVWD